MRYFLWSIACLGLTVGVGHGKCKWTVKGKVVSSGSKKPMKKAKLRVSARLSGKTWSSLRWPNPTTNGKGGFSGKSGTILTSCKKTRDLKVELKFNGKWVQIATLKGVKGKKKGVKVNFKTIQVDQNRVSKRAGCRQVSVTMQVKIGTLLAGRGVHVAFTEKELSLKKLKKWNVKKSLLKRRTNSESRISGVFSDCSKEAKAKKSRKIYVSYRGEFHGATQKVTIPKNGELKDTLTFDGAYLRPRLKPTVKFRLPVKDPSKLRTRKTFHIMHGPYGVDHDLRETATGRSSKGLAYSYDGRATKIGSSYPGHEGTDFMLKKGLKQMRKKDTNYVVAAANGTIIGYEDGHFDECDVKDQMKYNHQQKRKEKGKSYKTFTQCVSGTANVVKIRHADGLFTEYYHLKKGSAIEALKELGVPISELTTTEKYVELTTPFSVECGAIIGRIGSSGRSAGPHLHFNVKHALPGKTEHHADPYRGKLSLWSYWVKQNGPNSLPSTQCQ
jgi:murein DD-endopeptidase MepM/ murein hydrolase activator NlpD